MRRLNTLFLAAIVPIAGFGGACDDDPVTTPDTSVTDVGVDVSVDLGTEVEADAEPDINADIPPDTAIDPGTDTPDADASGPDVGDAPDGEDGFDTGDFGDSSDATTEVDAATDVQPDIEMDLPPPSCETDADCDDQLDCTTDACIDGACQWSINADTCLIGAICRTSGESWGTDDCRTCSPDDSQTQWTPLVDGTTCGPGDSCNLDVCVAGTCVPEEVDCGDGKGCTLDTCDPVEGCVHTPITEGAYCDDGDACTVGDVCSNGECVGLAINCDDNDPCTADSCDPDANGCVNTVTDGLVCDDGDPCTAGEVCLGGACQASTGPTDCNDGDACTLDVCDPNVGCVYLPTENPCCLGSVSVCDDGDPCTLDACDPVTLGCAYSFSEAPCDDGNACTESDVCDEGSCTGTALNCDDGEPCTSDYCQAGVCQNTPDTGAVCDDGVECTTSDACVEGVCVGDDTACVCAPTFAPVAMRVSSMQVGANGEPGEGLDVDADSGTCSPSDDCSTGIDNGFAPLGAFINGPIDGAVSGGSLNLLIELGDMQPGAVTLAVHIGNPGSGCTTDCPSYTVLPASLDPETCAPLFTLDGTWTGTDLDAGGPGSEVPLALPLGDATLNLTLKEARLTGAATVDADGLVSFEGVLGGAVAKAEILTALEAVPEGLLPFPKATVISVIQFLLTDDIDANNDGTPESTSIGLVLDGLPTSLQAP